MWVRGQVRTLYWMICAAGLVLLAASFGGALHPAGDSLAVFRLHISLACLVLLLPALRMRAAAGIACLAVALAALSGVLWTTFVPAGGDGGGISLYQKNLRFAPRDLAPLIDDIRDADPDLLTLQEVTPGNEALLTALADRLPTQLVCPFARVGAVAVASRWPLAGGETLCVERRGLAGIRVQTPQGPVWLVSLHLHWPWPHRQPSQREVLLPVLAGLEQPVVIGGDFNMVPWSHTLRSITKATETTRIGRAFNSMTRFPLVPLPIDHVLIPAGANGGTEKRPLLGSDHHGIVAEFSL